MIKRSLLHLRKFSARVVLASLLCAGATADELQLLWQIPGAADGSTLIGTGNNERGAAINPVTGNVLLVSRTGGNHIYILNGQTGDLIGELNLGDGVIGGGTFPISLIGVADDGAIYVGNLATANPPIFKLYRWENENADGPTIAFEGDPAGLTEAGASNNAQRWGDSMDVRGAGATTQVLLGSNAGTVAAILSTANGTDFTSKLISNAAPSGSLGVAFGAGNTFWTKRSAVALRHVSFNLETGVGTILRNVPVTAVPNTLSPIAVHASSNWLAGISINAGADDVRLYDISDPANIFIADQELFPVDQANGNNVGALDFHGDILIALDTNNGLVAYRVVRTVTAPSFVTQPASSSALAGGTVTLSANIAGTRPIDIRWQFNGADIPNATNSALTLTNLAAGNAGEYLLIASNASGALTSSVARLSIDLPASPGTLNLLWNLAPGSRPYITQGNTERGLAYNPATGRLLMVSRTGTAGIYVLNPEDGAELWQLQAPTDIVAGSNPGGFRLNMIAAADDGAIYAANLDTAGPTYAIYRWENDSADTVPTVAWAGAPVAARRWGDTFAARGAGANTQLLAASNVGTSENTNVVAIFTTADGVNFDAVSISTPGVNDDAFRLGVAFGAGNTFWGKATTFPLTQVQFDLAAGTGEVLRSITNLPSSSAPIGTQPASNWLAVVAFQTPDNIRLYDTTGTGGELPLIDGRALPSDIDNPNGTGAVVFAGDRLFVLDSNNGIQAYRIQVSSTGSAANLSAPARTAGTFSFTLTGSPNAAYRIQATSDFATWADVATVTTNAGGTAQVTDNTAQDQRFYRAVAKEQDAIDHRRAPCGPAGPTDASARLGKQAPSGRGPPPRFFLVTFGNAAQSAAMQHLLDGVHRFKGDEFGKYKALFRRLSREGQRPHTLFITCADSRIIAELITQSNPGDLFVIKNVGNIVPPPDPAGMNSTGAAIEFAVERLGVSDIVVCGHTQCGAIAALMDQTQGADLPHLANWVNAIAPVRETIETKYQHLKTPQEKLRAAEEENVLFSIERLRSYPVVERKLVEGTLRLHAWFFRIATADLFAYDAEQKQFVLIAPPSPA